MIARKLLRWSGLSSVLFGVLACSLLVDTSEIVAGCGAGMKYCANKCVRIDDAFYGCTESGCGECEELGDHTEVRCEGNQCVRKNCAYGWGCDDCSAPLFTDETNCGVCSNRCKTMDPEETCQKGVCIPVEGSGVAGAGGEAGN